MPRPAKRHWITDHSRGSIVVGTTVAASSGRTPVPLPHRSKGLTVTAIHAPTPDTRYRWVVLILCWAAFTMTSVDRATWGPAAGSVGEDLGLAVAGPGLFPPPSFNAVVV